MAEFKYAPMFQLGEDTTEYYKLTSEGVSVGEFEGHEILKVTPEALTMLSNAAFRDVNFLLRPAHNEQVAKILSDPEASDNDKYVALMFLRNAEVAAKGKLPFCQDTGTAIIHGEKGQQVWTGFDDKEALRRTSATARTPPWTCTRRSTPSATFPRRSTSTRRRAWNTSSSAW